MCLGYAGHCHHKPCIIVTMDPLLVGAHLLACLQNPVSSRCLSLVPYLLSLRMGVFNLCRCGETCGGIGQARPLSPPRTSYSPSL